MQNKSGYKQFNIKQDKRQNVPPFIVFKKAIRQAILRILRIVFSTDDLPVSMEGGKAMVPRAMTRTREIICAFV